MKYYSFQSNEMLNDGTRLYFKPSAHVAKCLRAVWEGFLPPETPPLGESDTRLRTIDRVTLDEGVGESCLSGHH